MSRIQQTFQVFLSESHFIHSEPFFITYVDKASLCTELSSGTNILFFVDWHFLTYKFLKSFSMVWLISLMVLLFGALRRHKLLGCFAYKTTERLIVGIWKSESYKDVFTLITDFSLSVYLGTFNFLGLFQSRNTSIFKF